jgi:hypothetical protein
MRHWITSFRLLTMRANLMKPGEMARACAVAAVALVVGLGTPAQTPDYYERNVIGGPGAFVIAAKTYEAFGDAILKKLITEIAGRAGGRLAGR